MEGADNNISEVDDQNYFLNNKLRMRILFNNA